VFIRKADDANEGIFGVMARFSRRLCQVDYQVRVAGSLVQVALFPVPSKPSRYGTVGVRAVVCGTQLPR
jgi:hypothetical protein